MSLHDQTFQTLLRKLAKFDVDTTRYDGDPMGWGDRPGDRILFLDIDGVMVGQKQWDAACKGLTYHPLGIPPIYAAKEACAFDPVAVHEVKRILSTTGARLVIHSDWAIGLTDADLLWRKLLEHGFSEDDFHPEWCLTLMSARLALQHGIRLHEGQWGINGDRDMRPWRIPAWLSWHAPESIAILDDRFVESWAPYSSAVPPVDKPSLAPASLDTLQPQPNAKWIRVGDPKTGRDVLSRHEADAAIGLLSTPLHSLANNTARVACQPCTRSIAM